MTDVSRPAPPPASPHVSPHASAHASPHPSPHASPHPSPQALPHVSPHVSPQALPHVFLHVGMPKTGTTFLQRRCFPALKGVCFVGKGYRVPATGIAERLWRVAEGHPLFVDMDAERAAIDRFLRGVAEDRLLISMERLFGDVMWGFRDHAAITEGLRRLFPAARIIVTVRRQDDLLESLYREALRVCYHPSADGFLNLFDDGFRPPPALPSCNVWRLDLHAYVRNYAASFGRRNVLVLPYEMMRADPRRFHGELAGFLGMEPYEPPQLVPENSSLSAASCRIALLLNRFVRAPWLERRPWRVIPYGRLRPVLENVVDRLPLPRRWSGGDLLGADRRRAILAIHRGSNRLLDEEYGLDLRRYGYY